ncbi:MAG: trehalose-phosphatase [Bacteroidales bacterium]
MKKKYTKKNIGLKAVILDMDGVITQTAQIHKKAWKKMFDVFLEGESENIEPFSDEDYIKYVDGKPRYKGVQSFLQSRNIDLPYGNPDDSEEKKSVCGLENRKNRIFIQLIESNGVEVYDDTVSRIKQWVDAGLKTAVISSSKNCKRILETANVLDLFDVRIDGVVSIERNLNGKPEPDIFFEAAKDMGVRPVECVVFEDAISGVQAGSKGNFAFVVGVNRDDNRTALLNNGADEVINNFTEVNLMDNHELKHYFKNPLINIFSELKEFEKEIKNKKPVLFLDYDGTLTPIVKHPEDAVLSDEMKEAIKACVSKQIVAVVSGRDMDNVKEMVGVEALYYAGSHGFRISGPDGLYHEHKQTKEILPKLNQIEKELNDNLSHIEGIKIERKRYAIAVHYRNVAEKDVIAIKDKVEALVNKSDGLKRGEGKKIVEIIPDIDWHKGKAIAWMLNMPELKEKENIAPIYIGDDITDENAFKEIENDGIGILVGFHDDVENTRARYSLKNVYQVKLFLEMLAQR